MNMGFLRSMCRFRRSLLDARFRFRSSKKRIRSWKTKPRNLAPAFNPPLRRLQRSPHKGDLFLCREMVRVDAQLQQRCVGWVFLDVPGRYGTDAEYTVVPLSPSGHAYRAEDHRRESAGHYGAVKSCSEVIVPARRS